MLGLVGAAALLISVPLVLASCGGDDGGSEPAQADGTEAEGATPLKVGTTLELPPVQFLGDDGQPDGFEYEMMQAVAEDLGYEPEIVKTPFEQAFVGLTSNRYEMFFSATYITCERIQGAEGAIEFSVPVYSDAHVLAADAERAPSLDSLDDLEGMTVGIESRGGTADALSTAYLEENPGYFEKEIFANVSDLLLALDQGRVDVAFAARITLLWGIRDKPDLAVGPPIEGTTFPVGWVFRQDESDDLKAEFNEAIHKLQEDGTFARIWEDWLAQPPSPDNPAGGETAEEVTSETCTSRG